jgi:hypothetical protein
MFHDPYCHQCLDIYLVCCSLSSFLMSRPEPDKLITATDTTNVHLKISMKMRKNYIVSFRKKL